MWLWFEMHEFKLIVVTTFMIISRDIAFIWIAQNPTDDNSSLGQVLAWCRQATSHYLGQCWSTHAIWSQWVNTV